MIGLFSQEERVQHLIEQIDMLIINAAALKKAAKWPRSATRSVHISRLIESSRFMINACTDLLNMIEELESKTTLRGKTQT